MFTPSTSRVRHPPPIWDPFGLVRNLMRWDPAHDAEGPSPGDGAFKPSFDIKETESSYEFFVDLPGLHRSDIQLRVSGNQLSVSGSRKQDQLGKNENYYALERATGDFSRTFNLPGNFDPQAIKAGIVNGILSIFIPKLRAEEAFSVVIDE